MLTHVTENLLRQVRDGEPELTAELISLILSTLDEIKILLASIKVPGQEEPDRTEPLRGPIEDACRSVLPGKLPESVPHALEPALPQPEVPRRRPTIYLRNSEPDQMRVRPDIGLMLALDTDRVLETASQSSLALSESQATIEFQLDGTILTANSNLLGLLGYRLEEIKGRRHSMLLEESEPGTSLHGDPARLSGRCPDTHPDRAAHAAARVHSAIGTET